MNEELRVKKSIDAMLYAVDKGEWDELAEYFTENVLSDYSSLTGAEATEINAVEMIGGWKAFLPGFDATQHFLSNVRVDIEGDEATAVSYVNAVHYLATDETVDTWSVNGFYEHKLVKIDGQWKISAIKLDVAGVLGNTDLPRLAGEKLQEK